MHLKRQEAQNNSSKVAQNYSPLSFQATSLILQALSEAAFVQDLRPEAVRVLTVAALGACGAFVGINSSRGAAQSKTLVLKRWESSLRIAPPCRFLAGA